MSLINEVLRDLESKRPDALAHQNLQREIRALPPVRHKMPISWWWILGFVLILLTGTVFYFQADRPLQIQSKLPATDANLLQPPPERRADSEVDKLRLAFELAVPPLPLPEEAPPSLPTVKSLSPVTKLEAAPVVSVPPSLSKSELERTASGVVRIDKTPALATPRDLAEMELRKAEQAVAGGRMPEAIDAWQMALQHDPAFIAPRQALVAQLLAQRRLTEVVKLLEEGLSLQPGQTPWVLTLARVQLEQGALNKADETLARFQNQALHLPEYAGFQAHLKSRLGAHGEAIGHYMRAVRMAPGEGRWWLGLGLELQAEGKVGDAKEAFRRALATSTLSAELVAVAQQQIQN